MPLVARFGFLLLILVFCKCFHFKIALLSLVFVGTKTKVSNKRQKSPNGNQALQAIGDEKQILVKCPICVKQKIQLYKKLVDMHYDINEMEDSEKFIWLLKQENNNCIHWIGNYIYSAMKTRKNFLKIPRDHPLQTEQLVSADIYCQITFRALM